MNGLIYPQVQPADLWRAGRFAVAGALLAGGYGALHDQMTYTISPEYFTRLKFAQFRAADFGLPARILVAEIGFLSSWWVGLIGGWFLARIAVRDRPAEVGRRLGRAAAIIAAASAGTAVAAGCGASWLVRGEAWSAAMAELGVDQPADFTRVAAIHWGSYLGAFGGWAALAVGWWRSGAKIRRGTFLIDAKG
jgi:hypothetical protein